MTTTFPDQVDQYRRRLLQDVLTQATAHYWRRRADDFDAAAHRPGIDWPGQATPDQLAAQQARCRAVALACRRRALIETWTPVTWTPEVLA